MLLAISQSCSVVLIVNFVDLLILFGLAVLVEDGLLVGSLISVTIVKIALCLFGECVGRDDS